MISFIVPAHNEEQLLGRTLAALHAAAPAAGEPFEIIVVDDASTDQTAEVARRHGAHVLHVNHRHIAATRNAGARAAGGELFFFVDADTVATAAAVRAGVRAMRRGAVGGGCMFRYDGRLPLWAGLVYPLGAVLGRVLRVVGGCFLFCTRQAFERCGGFPERYYAGEELALTRSLKGLGRFVVPPPRVITSARKIHMLSVRHALVLLARIAAAGPEAFRQREEIWYGERRPDPDAAHLALPPSPPAGV